MDLIAQMREQRDATKAARDALLQTVYDEKRTTLTVQESERFDALSAELRGQQERYDELLESELREVRSAETRLIVGQTGEQRTGLERVVEPPVYSLQDLSGPSWFRDLHKAKTEGDRDALDRLVRSAKGEAETRALGNTGAVGGSGGEFAPPVWLVKEFVKLARPGRVAADLFTKQVLPDGVSSVNIPKVATGTSVAIQTTQNSTLAQTDLTTTSINSGIVTIGGKQVVSQQLLDQTQIAFDQVILQDLALAYAGFLDVQALTGAGTGGTLRGLGNAAGKVTQTYTTATPAVTGTGQFYSQLVQAIATVYANRYLAPDTILMHPRRWAWVAAALDTQNRPLLPLVGQAVNPIGANNSGDAAAQGFAGQIAGLDVYVDPNLPTNLGAGTNQDVVYVLRRGDIMLWETAPRAETFREPYAESVGVLFRLYSYAAMVPDRYGSSIVSISGTGLITPSF